MNASDFESRDSVDPVDPNTAECPTADVCMADPDAVSYEGACSCGCPTDDVCAAGACAADARAASGISPDDLPDEELLYELADLFKVFSDTTRIKILYALMGRELCVADIAAETANTQSAVSHQLRILKSARLVRFRREGRSIIYALADNHVYTMLAQGMTHICE